MTLTGKEQLLWQYLDYRINECHSTPSLGDMQKATCPGEALKTVHNRLHSLCKKGRATKEGYVQRGGIKLLNKVM